MHRRKYISTEIERNAVGRVRHLLHERGLWIVASRADGYRRRACLEMAGTFKDRDAGATLAHMAQVWLRLADNCEDVNEGARGSKAAEQGQPVVQQQQRNQPKQGEL